MREWSVKTNNNSVLYLHHCGTGHLTFCCNLMFMIFLSVTASCFALLSPAPCWCCSINPQHYSNLRERKKKTTTYAKLQFPVSPLHAARPPSQQTWMHPSLSLSPFFLQCVGDLEHWHPAAPFHCCFDGGGWMTLLRVRAPRTDAAKTQWRNGAALLKGTWAPKLKQLAASKKPN